jgi:hypothetical protein
VSYRRLRSGVVIGVVALLVGAGQAWAGGVGGTQRWSASFDAGTPAFSYDVAVSPDGATVYATGTTNYGTSAPRHYATVAVDAQTGAQRWAAVYRSSTVTQQHDQATRIAVSPDGSKLFVTGASWCGCGGSAFEGYSTVAYDAATGSKLWASSYAHPGPGAYSIAVSPDSSEVFVNGQTDTANDTVAYDAATGTQLFVISVTKSLVPWEGLAVSPDSATVYVATTVDLPASPCGYRIAAYDASDGTPRWSATYANCGGEGHLAISLSSDGSRLVAAGYGNQGFVTVAFDASTGAQLWASAASGVRTDGDVEPKVAFSPDGTRVFIVGYRCPSSCFGRRDQPFETVGYDAATGEELWQSSYDSGAENYPNDLAVNADGSQVFVTGQEQMPCYPPCTVIKVNAPLVAYDAATGVEAWVADYQDNAAWALAASPDGSNVYLAGTFTTAASASTQATPMTGQRAASCSPSACGYSMAAYNTHAGPGTVQDRDPSTRYDGWTSKFDKAALGGAYRESREHGERVTLNTAKTTSLVWVTRRGPAQGKARVWIDGHSKGTYDLYAASPSRRSISFTGLSRMDHTITVEVLGTKNPASHGRWVTVDAFKIGRNIREETASAVRYGTWRGRSNRHASGGSYRVSSSSNARLSLTVTGTRIAWITTTGRAFGKARVVIDGVRHTVDLYRPAPHWRTKITFTGLGPGRHRITIRPLHAKDPAATSANIVFDALVIR